MLLGANRAALATGLARLVGDRSDGGHSSGMRDGGVAARWLAVGLAAEMFVPAPDVARSSAQPKDTRTMPCAASRRDGGAGEGRGVEFRPQVSQLLREELQRRGIYRTAYEGSTLRQNLGLPVPASRYAAAAKRPAAMATAK